MKKHFFIIIFLITSIVAYSQSHHTFSKVHYWASDSIFSGEQVMGMVHHDSTVFMAIRAFYPGDGWFLNIVKTDLHGNMLDKVNLGTNYRIGTVSPYGFYWHDIDGDMMIVDRDTNLVICTQELEGAPRKAVLLKLNRDLDTLWTRKYLLPDSLSGSHTGPQSENYFTAVEQTPDGGYIVAGVYIGSSSGIPQMVLVKFDSSGNVIWERIYDNIWSSYNISITPDSGFVFSGHFGTHFQVTRTDKHGNIIWQDSIEQNPGEYWDQWKTKTGLDSQNHIVSMAQFKFDFVDVSSYKTGISVIKHDYQGNKMWQRNYYDFFVDLTSTRSVDRLGSPRDSPQMRILPNDGIIISASAFVVHPFYTLSGNYKGVLLKLDSQGDSLWMRYYNVRHLADVNIFQDIVLLDNGDFLIGGYFQPFIAYENHWYGSLLLRTDSLGMNAAAHTVKVEELGEGPANELVRIFPNPAKDVLYFDLDAAELNPHSFELTMYNTMGERVKQMDLASGQTAVNVALLTSGVYLYRIYCPLNQKKYTGKFIKQ